MQFVVVLRILGLLLTIFSTTMLPPLAISWWTNDGVVHSFMLSFLLIMLLGLVLWFPARHIRRDLRLRDGFVVVVLFWAGLGVIGSLPLLITHHPYMSVSDAVFESVSGLTTTGATVLTGIDYLPRSIQFYRQQLQWLGGMGIIVLAVAILPMLGIGGMQLYRAETPGPVKDTKLTPRIAETAKALWNIYLTLTVICALLYWFAGMSAFDAVAHSFATISIGGFSTHDLSIGYFHSRLIDAIAVVFMILAGMNFTLHFMTWQSFSIRQYLHDAEAKMYLLALCVVCVISCSYLLLAGIYPDFASAITHGVFQTVSIATTTGFTTATYQSWPTFLPILLLFASFMGACAGSTGGGLKVMRVLLLFKQGWRELQRLIHPNAVFAIKLGERPVEERVISAVWGFFASYVFVFALLMLMLMATGLDQITAFSAMAACLNNLGPGLGAVSTHYGDINEPAKWLLCLAMLLGRLEIFTLLVILTPAFWSR